MLERLTLQDVGPAPAMELAFAPRLNLFTGDNGLGKTFVLETAWYALTHLWTGYPAAPRRTPGATPTLTFRTQRGNGSRDVVSRFDFEEQAWLTNSGGLETPYLVLYARVDGGCSAWDPLRLSGHHHFPSGALSSGPVPGFHFTAEQLWNGLLAEDHDRTVLCNGLLRDWVTWQLQRSHAFEVFSRVLQVLSPNPEETIRPGASTTRMSIHDVRDIPTLSLPHGEIPVLLASAGMKRIMALAYLLVWMWREHVEIAKLKNRSPLQRLVLLVDEIEAHLHPQWQRVILPALLRVAQELDPSMNVQLIVTTHAPLVLASAEPHFDEERDALFRFDLKEGQVTIDKLPWRPRGDASAWLTSEVFDLGQARSIEAEQAIQAAMAAMREPHLSIEQIKQVHEDLHAVLKDTDPFWARWVVRAKLAGIEP